MTNTIAIEGMSDLIDAIEQGGGGGGSSTLAGLSDVAITSASNGQLLTYDSTAEKWENETLSLDIDDLVDVDITNPSNGQQLTYDSTAEKWVNTTPSAGGGLSVAELSLASATWEETSSGSGIWQTSILKENLGITDNNDIISVMACSPTNAASKNIPKTIYPVDALESSSATYFRLKLKTTTSPSGVYIKVIYA